jgi:type II secretory pathway pseudopilin PulG
MNTREEGFSYIEVMIAIVILMVGILAMLSAITGGVLRSKVQEQQLEAKQIAASTMESIMSVKETDPSRLGWPALGNVGSNPNADGIPQGIFLTGERDVRSDPGPDEIMGTADDTGSTVTGYKRQIVITDRCDPDRPSTNCPTPGPNPIRIRTVEVTVFYYAGRIRQQERLTTVLTDYAVTQE